MARFIKNLFDSLSLQNLYEIVLNSCLCSCECCSRDYGCKCMCHSKEIDHPPPDDDFIGCVRICCGGSQEIASDVEDVLSSDGDDPHLFSSNRNI